MRLPTQAGQVGRLSGRSGREAGWTARQQISVPDRPEGQTDRHGIFSLSKRSIRPTDQTKQADITKRAGRPDQRIQPNRGIPERADRTARRIRPSRGDNPSGRLADQESGRAGGQLERPVGLISESSRAGGDNPSERLGLISESSRQGVNPSGRGWTDQLIQPSRGIPERAAWPDQRIQPSR